MWILERRLKGLGILENEATDFAAHYKGKQKGDGSLDIQLYTAFLWNMIRSNGVLGKRLELPSVEKIIRCTSCGQ